MIKYYVFITYVFFDLMITTLLLTYEKRNCKMQTFITKLLNNENQLMIFNYLHQTNEFCTWWSKWLDSRTCKGEYPYQPFNYYCIPTCTSQLSSEQSILCTQQGVAFVLYKPNFTSFANQVILECQGLW